VGPTSVTLGMKDLKTVRVKIRGFLPDRANPVLPDPEFG
jgi:hypothetical protein